MILRLKMNWVYKNYNIINNDPDDICDNCKYKPIGNVCNKLKAIVPKTKTCNKFKRK